MASTALLATVADAKASQLAGGVAPVMPSGVILPYGGATAPTGWLLCDGSTKSRTDYADLFAAIGTAHGSGDGSTTFHLPDLRGRFLRGVSGASTNDPDRTTRTAANTGGNTGNLVGSVQDNATKKNGLAATAQNSTVTGTTNIAHTHGASSLSVDNTNLAHSHSITTGANGRIYTEYFGPASQCRFVGNAGPYQGSNEAYAESNLGNHAHGGTAAGQALATSNISIASGSAAAQAITVGNGDAETRPLNANVNYIIKV
ncbi:MAG: phage tail protein [Ilumatobacteraceae bacterium]